MDGASAAEIEGDVGHAGGFFDRSRHGLKFVKAEGEKAVAV